MQTTTPTRAEAIKRACAIDGWLTQKEAGALYDLAKSAKGPIFEIGSWRGRSTAALALGSMAGEGHPIYAIDSFVGVPETDRMTAQGNQVGPNSSSVDILRKNLDDAGVNGLVKIIPISSNAAAPYMKECSVLFIDGDHQYESIKRDLTNYLPKVMPNGSVVIHDCWEMDPDVIKATEQFLCNDPQWSVGRRVDSAIVAVKRQSAKRKVFVAAPGPNFIWGACKGFMTASLTNHEVNVVNKALGWDDMADLWVQALNSARKGVIDTFAMLHSDIVPDPGWLDTLLFELEEHKADMISVVVPIKDKRGLTSCGVGDPDNHYGAFRRFTMHEIMEMPETFSITDTPHPDKYLLNNSGCIAIDLRNPKWFSKDENGILNCTFAFPIRARELPDGEIVHERESEDWYFSRNAHALGLKLLATRKVSVSHVGGMDFPNDHSWGIWKNDKHTENKWRSESAVSQ